MEKYSEYFNSSGCSIIFHCEDGDLYVKRDLSLCNKRIRKLAKEVMGFKIVDATLHDVNTMKKIIYELDVGNLLNSINPAENEDINAVKFMWLAARYFSLKDLAQFYSEKMMRMRAN